MRRSVSTILIHRRVIAMLLTAMCFTLLLVGRLAYLQIARNRFFQDKAVEQRIQRIPVEGRRGSIYDRNGIPLAVSINATSVYAIPAEVENKEQTARILAQILNLDYETVLARLNKRTASEWVKKKVSLEEAEAVIKAGLPGVGGGQF